MNFQNSPNLIHNFLVSKLDSKRGTALACTGLRSKHTLAGLIPNKKYFVDVFGIHKMVPGLIFKLASTSLVFNYTNPIELREDQTEFGKLSEFDKRTSFVFKVRELSSLLTHFQSKRNIVIFHFNISQIVHRMPNGSCF